MYWESYFSVAVGLMILHRQQNKCHPQRCILAHFEAQHSILVVENLLGTHNNIRQICYSGQILLQNAATTKLQFF